MAEEQAGLSWKKAPTSLALCRGEDVVWRLVADPNDPKSYFHPLATLDGKVLTEFQPKDHPWHHWLWWSWKFINGVNYWEENPKTHKSEGVTELTSVTFQPAGDFSATAELSFSYHLPGKASLMTEQRKLAISAPDADGSYWIDWTSTFKAGVADVVLGRTPIPGEKNGKGYGGYAGLSARLVLEPEGWMIGSNAMPVGSKDFHCKKARWVDFWAEGKGIAIFDHPKNLRAPSPWYVHDRKPMSYFSPAVLFNKPLTLAAGQSLTLRYRVLIHSKPMNKEQLEAKFREFIQSATPDSSKP